MSRKSSRETIITETKTTEHIQHILFIIVEQFPVDVINSVDGRAGAGSVITPVYCCDNQDQPAVFISSSALFRTRHAESFHKTNRVTFN